MITPYLDISGSNIDSLKSIPSVQYLSYVFELVLSSNLIVYPTSSPKGTSISDATLAATLIAATLLGWVHAMWRPFASPDSKMNYGTCVVLPEPVSPCKTNT
jgi:hypothetical protein